MRIKLFFVVTLLSISACTNWKEEPAIARMILVNALPGADQVEFRHNGQLLQNQPFKYGTFSVGYLNLQAGRKNFSVNQSGQTAPIIDKTLFLPDFKNYSAFLTRNTILSPAKDTLLIYPDTLVRPTAGNIRIRFINLYPEDEANTTLNLFYYRPTITPVSLFSNRKFMNISTFSEIDTSSSYVFRVIKNGVLVDNVSLADTLNEEISYTILATDSLGIPGQGEKRIKLQLIKHK